jgi:hypothetical protein
MKFDKERVLFVILAAFNINLIEKKDEFYAVIFKPLSREIYCYTQQWKLHISNGILLTGWNVNSFTLRSSKRTLTSLATDVRQFLSILCLLSSSIHFQLWKIILCIYWKEYKDSFISSEQCE